MCGTATAGSSASRAASAGPYSSVGQGAPARPGLRHVRQAPLDLPQLGTRIDGARELGTALQARTGIGRPRLLLRDVRQHAQALDLASSCVEIAVRAGDAEHVVFAQPVLLTIDYGRCAAGLSAQQALTAWHIDETSKALLENMSGVDLRALHVITVYTGHLSGYAVAD